MAACGSSFRGNIGERTVKTSNNADRRHRSGDEVTLLAGADEVTAIRKR